MPGVRDLAVKLIISAKDRASRVVGSLRRGIDRFATGAIKRIASVGTAVTGLVTGFISLRTALAAISNAASAEDLEQQFLALEGSAEARRGGSTVSEIVNRY